jgi:perosamine synthetase
MQLAINGAKSIRTKSFPQRQLYNKESIKQKLNELIDSDNLSGFRGSFGQHFFGGENVRKLEEYFENYLYEHSGLKTKYYVLAVNSCTSALHISCGAIGLQPYDEVIVTPWTMTCSATMPLAYGSKPVFADIEKDYFCIDPESIESKITEKTKAIIAVDLFGQPYDVEKINAIAKKHNLFVIEDVAQALGSTYNGNQAGTLGDIGCFSFTQGKHFTCGEGGFIVTKDVDLYMKCALIRNHCEAVINSMPNNLQKKYLDMKNQFGFNLRMTEMQAIVLYEQFVDQYYMGDDPQYKNNINKEIFERQKNVYNLTEKIKIDGIEFAKVRENCTHSYYVLPFLFDEEKNGVSRNKFIEAVKAELTISKTEMGITTKIDALIWEKYITPIYKMPLFQRSLYSYYDVNLPNVEELQDNKFCMMSYHALPLSNNDIDDIANAFMKVYENREELK